MSPQGQDARPFWAEPLSQGMSNSTISDSVIQDISYQHSHKIQRLLLPAELGLI